MLFRPMMRVGRPGLLGVAARTAVVAGTATAVTGAVARRGQARQQPAQESSLYEQQQQAETMQPTVQHGGPRQAPAGAPTGSEDLTSQLERLGQLKQEGVLSDAEFTAAKSKLLGV